MTNSIIENPQSWAETTTQGLQDLWKGFLNFTPDLIGALVVFIIGWIVAVFVGKLVAEILARAKFDQIFERGVWKTALEKAELDGKASAFIGAIIKWILALVFFSAAVEILGLESFSASLDNVLAYVPNVIVAAFLFAVTVVVVDIVEKIVRATVEGMKVGYGNFISAIVKWSIWVFAILAILTQLKIAPGFMTILLQGIVITLALGIGLSFGLGGKEVAEEILKDVKKKLNK